MPTLVPERFTMMGPWLVAIAAFVLLAAAPALGATSAQQVYETPETGQTPSPLPNLPAPPAGELLLPGPFTPRTVQGPGPTPAGPLVAGQPAPTSSPCVPAAGATPGTGSGSGLGAPAGAEECAPAPVAGDDTRVRNEVTPGPGGSTPVAEVASGSGPAPAAGRSGALPVTGLDLILILAAAATAAGVGFIDAAGLGCIVRAENRLAGRGGALAVRRPSRRARRLFELCEMGELLS